MWTLIVVIIMSIYFRNRACYCSVQNILLSELLLKNVSIDVYKLQFFLFYVHVKREGRT
jgi:hypothetical protein